jgi:hypothetical protein
MVLHLLAVLLLAQQIQPGKEAKQVTALVAQIRRLAASEPVVYGIDTRLRAGEVLSAKYPKIAKDLLRDAQAAIGGVTEPAEQDSLRVRMVERMAPLDLDEAERFIGSIRRGGDEDYVAQAYDHLVEFLAHNHGDSREMITKGLQSGGFRSGSALRKLEESKTADPSGAVALFSEILGAFPTQSPGERDVYYLLECTKQISGLNRPLAVEAIDKALSAANSQKLRITSVEKEKDRKAAGQKMLREIATMLGSIDPELLERYKSEHEELNLAMTAEESAKPEQERKSDTSEPDLSEQPYSEALSRARKIQDPSERVGSLIEIYRRESITPQQRASVASEALTAATTMPITNDRLTAMAMISRDFARLNQPANAAFAAQLLSETFSKACDCEHATCDRSGEKFDCLDLLNLFAEYLEEFKISAELMNLNNISLEARLLILKLYPLLGLKVPSLFSFGN